LRPGYPGWSGAGENIAQAEASVWIGYRGQRCRRSGPRALQRYRSERGESGEYRQYAPYWMSRNKAPSPSRLIDVRLPEDSCRLQPDRHNGTHANRPSPACHGRPLRV
jgi:hypothetical protein